MNWYAVRTLYAFGIKDDSTNVFEERIVCFSALSADEAFQKSERESERYAADNRLEAHPERELYVQDGERLIDSYELWSQLFESELSLHEFYRQRYEIYRYSPPAV